MIPLGPDGGGDFTVTIGDAGAGSASDAFSAAPSADAGRTHGWDATVVDAVPGVLDSNCRRAGGAADAGYIDENGAPCDPAEARGDGGARDASAACDASTDAVADGADCHDGAPVGRALGAR